MSALHAELLLSAIIIKDNGGVTEFESISKRETTIEQLILLHRPSHAKDNARLPIIADRLTERGIIENAFRATQTLQHGVDILKTPPELIKRVYALTYVRCLYRTRRSDLAFPELKDAQLACTVYFLGAMLRSERLQFTESARHNMRTAQNKGLSPALMNMAYRVALMRDFPKSFFTTHFVTLVSIAQRLGLNNEDAYEAYLESLVKACWLVAA